MENLNKRLFMVDEQGHSYYVPEYKIVPGEGIQITGLYQKISFVKGSKIEDENQSPALSGTLHEHLLSVMIHDLGLKNIAHPAKETEQVIMHLQEAVNLMEERARKRQAAGVLGTYQAHQS